MAFCGPIGGAYTTYLNFLSILVPLTLSTTRLSPPHYSAQMDASSTDLLELAVTFKLTLTC